nr:zinc finger, RING/FYVE/PHD-type [Tanacetum cinerariifolium]
EVENLGLKDNNSYANLLEHRANFLEGRRRIRSQVV